MKNSNQKKENQSPDLSILMFQNLIKFLKAIKNSEIVSDGVIFTKSIANLPPNECTPTTLATFAKGIAKKGKMKCVVFSKKELEKKGFGGITAVGSR